MSLVATARSECNLPFLKWAGGKRWLAGLLTSLFGPHKNCHYVEPFVGAGSVFFSLRPAAATLGDSNSELIHAYEVVRDSPEALIRSLRRRTIGPEQFESARSRIPSHPISRASRFLYLNRTAFNGLYRVNRRGEFNVPFGCKPGTTVCNAGAIRRSSLALAGAQLTAACFRETLDSLPDDSLAYLDPPYTVAHNNNGFVRYNERLFRWEDQVDLAAWARGFAAAGGKVVVSNAAHDQVVRLYPRRHYHRFVIDRFSPIAGEVDHRRRYAELVAVSRSVATPGEVKRLADQHGLVIAHLDG